MTNLEWIRTLSAKELSDLLYDYWLPRGQYVWTDSRKGLVKMLGETYLERDCDKCKHQGNCYCVKGLGCPFESKTEPQPTTDCRQTGCYMCKWLGEVDVCGRCRNRNLFAEADTEPKPKDEPITQTKTQNSNLTFKTLEYCDICDHKGCEECIANALDEHCIPSQFNKQIEDECAKEYEELGLKELKELIEADRKTEPTISKMEQVEDEPRLTAKCLNCANGGSYKCSKCDGEMYYKYDKDEPQTEERTIQCTGDCEHCSRLFVDCDGR